MKIHRGIYLRIQLEVIAYANYLSYFDVGKTECACIIINLTLACSYYCLGCVTNSDKCTSCNQDDFRELLNN